MFIEQKKPIAGITALILLVAITSIPSSDAGGPVTTLKITKLSSFGDDTFDFTVTGPTPFNPSIATVGGLGTNGPTNVAPGTYSIQENIPAGWDLTTASCTDGSSIFSIDTVSGIIINFEDAIECTFENIVSGISEPDQVTGLSATSTIGFTTIDLAWNAPFDGGLPITGYAIERESPLGDGFSILVADTESTATSFENRNLLFGTQYNYKISAINEIGTGLASSEANATIFTPTFILSDQTSCEASPFFGTWNGLSSECTISNLAINIGETLQIESTADLIITGTFDNFGLVISDARINVLGTFNNEGNAVIFAFTVLGTFDNLGTYTGIEDLTIVGGVFNNFNTVFNENGCSISPSSGGIVNNHGVIFNQISGTIESGLSGTINNFGTINNLEPGIFIGAGPNGVFNNFGAINNVASSQITSSGTFDNSGTINNLGGTIDIFDTLNNFNLINNLGGVINISPSGTIDNQGIICAGTFNNLGIFTGNPFEAACTPGTLKITKITTGGDATFDFTVTGPTSFNSNILTIGGMGIDGPTNVIQGTYSIQETIPVGWDLTTASCNDGSSMFSIDEVTGIIIAPANNIECTFENQISEDADNDGIFNEIDLLPAIFSDDFDDLSLGGTTDGLIVDRGDQILTISEEVNPDGVRVNADVSGGPTPGEVEFCSSMSSIEYNAGDETVVTCSSVTITVISGQPFVEFASLVDSEGTTTLTAGNSITFDQTDFSFTAPATNTETIVISVGGEETLIPPGSTVLVPPTPTSGPDADSDGINDEIDLLPAIFSDDFDDLSLGGTTDGLIVDRGDQILTISEEVNPDGVRVNADVSGGSLFGEVEFCDAESFIGVNPGDEAVVTCSSVIVTVISGQPLLTFIGIDETEATTTLTAGNSITFDQTDFSFTAPATNTETVIISVNGDDTPIAPGVTVSIPLLPSQFARPDSDPTVRWVNGVGDAPCTDLNTFNCVDEEIRDDDDYIQTIGLGKNNSDKQFYTLSDITDPMTSSGHVLRYTITEADVGVNPVELDVILRQGETVIASFHHENLPTGFTLIEQTLTAAQADSITDYTDLEITLDGNCDKICKNSPGSREKIQVSWMEFAITSNP